SAVGGRDDLGQEILHRLRQLGIGTRYIHLDARHPTGTVSVTLDAAGIPSYVIHKDVAWDFLRDSDALHELAQRTDVVCFGSLAQRAPTTRQTITSFLKHTREEALRVFDINLRQQYYNAEIVAASLAHASVLKINDEEVPKVADLLDLPREEGQTMEVLLAKFPLQLIALTRGGRGSSLYTREESSHHDGFPVEIVDTVGAGDAFTAALAVGLLRRQPLNRINTFANRLASYVCSQPGATPRVPEALTNWDEL
ncbi:MAG TPA: carbohydrate kinase, partial [Tepidisphaeraceae bacterium]